MMSIEKPPLKVQNFKPLTVSVSSKHTALKGDVIGPENILFAGASVLFSAGKFYRL